MLVLGEAELGVDLVAIHLKVDLCDGTSRWVRGIGWLGFYDPPSGLLEMIAEIPGVVEIRAQGYEMQISKGRLFDWEEILPGVETALTVLPPPRGKESLG